MTSRSKRNVFPRVVKAVGIVAQVVDDQAHQLIVGALTRMKSIDLLLDQIEKSREVAVVGVPSGKRIGQRVVRARGFSAAVLDHERCSSFRSSAVEAQILVLGPRIRFARLRLEAEAGNTVRFTAYPFTDVVRRSCIVGTPAGDDLTQITLRNCGKAASVKPLPVLRRRA